MNTNIFAKLSLTTLLAIAPAFGESAITAKIPFDFTVNRTKMTAGNYTVRFDIPGAMSIYRDDRKAVCIALTTAVQANTPQPAKLVFNRYGDSYFLSQVWGPGADRGRQLPKSKPELEVARTINRVQRASVPVTSHDPVDSSR
ncbi:MAG: hypothetical protein ACKV2U_16265 [Bryobacteraceae bacterium]